MSAETPAIATPETGYTDSGEPAQPSQASGGDGGGRRRGNRRAWLGVGAAILTAALSAAVAVFALTRDSHSTAGLTTTATTETAATGDAIIVWTHDRLGTPSHLDFVGVAQLRGRGAESSLFSWWNFWHSRLGKCPLPGCEAHLP